ncbi:MAG TPA: hypothetical protein VL769_07010, partial [Acidimicrobiia bacterium]|nr:hypothetical protein [Acidimicrobiia bacterium]
ATTLDEYRKYVEKDPALERRFQQVYVGEPSVEDTIAILRGLKERYEVHHGVRIQDAAIVAAAVLSDRYISGRQLPDKAIDLIDEAASRLRIEIDSMPFEIDVVERRIRQLEIEKAALAKETDEPSKQRLAALEEELATLAEERDAMVAHWQNEKDAITEIRALKERYEVHHGVRIQDAALVAAAVLSHRYIPARQLPDKAIDLIDEAASRLRIEIDSMPFEIDVVERRIRQLEIEKAALAKETDEQSKQRLAAIEEELRDLAYDRLRDRARDPESDAGQAANKDEKRLEQARRAVAKAIGALTPRSFTD